MDGLKRFLLDGLRTPPEPDPPEGAEPDSLQVFRAAPAYLQYKLLLWGIRQAGVIVGLAFALMVTSGWGPGNWIAEIPVRPVQQILAALQTVGGPFSVFEAIALAAFLTQLPFSFLLVVLDYEYRWYMVTDRSLRIREGVWSILEQTMTFANIQNVTVRQNPLQRWFGLAEVEVRSAGGSDSAKDDTSGKPGGRNLHLAYFRGVDNAEEIRDLVLNQMRRLKAAGLGDPDDAVERRNPPAAAEAAAEMLREARLLRSEVRSALTSPSK